MNLSKETTKNRKQAVRRGGVKTPEGKAISRYNAVKHGILRETVTDYEKVEAGKIYNDLASDLKPSGKVQEVLVEMMTSNLVRLQRIAKAEAEFVREFTSPDIISSMPNRGYRAEFPVPVVDRLLVYSRYQTAAENRIIRILGVLNQLKHYE